MRGLANRLLVMLVFGMALAGCTSNRPYVSNNKHSFAWNVAKAGGLYPKDVSWEKVQEIRTTTPDSNPGGPNVLGAAVFGVNEGLRVGSLLSGGLGSLAWLTLGNSTNPKAMSQMFAWMPQSMANTPEEAHDKITTIVDEAFERALQATPFPEPYEVSTERTGKRYSISGGDCSQDGVVCGYSGLLFNYPPVSGKAPEFLGGDPAWAWFRPAKNYGVVFHRSFVRYGEWSNKAEARFPDLELLLRFSNFLPKWVYLYVTPGVSRFSISDGDGGFQFLACPIILNEGKIYLFEEPKPDNQ